MLPGVLMRNEHLQFRCQWVNLRVENADTRFLAKSGPGDVLRVPISHGEGNYHADEDVLRELEANGQVVFRYSTAEGAITQDANPNGSMANIAGIVNADGNVLGMMPHPERCCEELMGGVDGAVIFRSIIDSVIGTSPASSETAEG